ncbi:MAG: hypothetical protein HYU66_22800 [Armatimonadetes bacterium]|nr:hypothetical protein [Armatimonadota bacterium]
MPPHDLPDLRAIPPDLVTPPMLDADPAPGRRVRQTLPEYRHTQVHHALYLPTDWAPGGRFPVLVEYAGNGGYRNEYGDESHGVVEGSNLGYGISGGEGFLWLCLPFVGADGANQTQWWGDIEATCDYCRQAVRFVCVEYGGDAERVILCGFSRGAMACGYVGLHDDATAALWCGFVAYSHWDGADERFAYTGSDWASAQERLKRLDGRPAFICHEGGTTATEAYLRSTRIEAPFTFMDTGFRNHNDAWVLRDCPARRALREWVAGVVGRRALGYNHLSVEA